MDFLSAATIVSIGATFAGGLIGLVGYLSRQRPPPDDAEISLPGVAPPYAPTASPTYVPPPYGGQLGRDNDPWGTLMPGQLDPVPPAPAPPTITSYSPVQQRPLAPPVARKGGDDDVAIRVAKMGGGFALLGVLGTGLFGLASGLMSQSSSDDFSCLDQRTKAAELSRAYPGTWIPLEKDDPAQRHCAINEFVSRLG